MLFLGVLWTSNQILYSQHSSQHPPILPSQDSALAILSILVRTHVVRSSSLDGDWATARFQSSSPKERDSSRN